MTTEEKEFETTMTDRKEHMIETIRSVYEGISLEHKQGAIQMRQELEEDMKKVGHLSTVQVIQEGIVFIDQILAKYKRREIIFLGEGKFDYVEHDLTDEEIENPDLFLPKLIEDAHRVMEEMIEYGTVPQP